MAAAQPVTHPLPWFFLLTYAATWACWATAGAISHQTDPSTPALAVIAAAMILLGTFAPALVAIALTERTEGRAATRALLRRVCKFRVGARWYVFALSYMLTVKLSVALLHRLASGEWPRFGQQQWYLMAAAIAVSTWVQAGEEIGWRGYALPRMSDQFGLASASVILGIIWAIWHLPLFLVPGSDTFGQSFPLYLLQVTALSVAAAWLYWRTNGSLLLVMLLHASINNTKNMVPSVDPGATNPFALSTSPVAWLTAGVLWVVAACLLVQMARAGPAVCGWENDAQGRGQE